MLVHSTDYFSIFVFFCVAVLLSAFMLLIPKLFARKAPSYSKNTPYECGFDSFGDARYAFDVRFYLVGMLFIVFDLEITFLIPWAVHLKKLGIFGFYSMILFLFVLIVGFVYELSKGALDW